MRLHPDVDRVRLAVVVLAGVPWLALLAMGVADFLHLTY